MNFFTVAIYVILDDILKAVEHKEDPQRKVNDAMVLTTLLIACRYFGGNIEKAACICKATIVPKCSAKANLTVGCTATNPWWKKYFIFLPPCLCSRTQQRTF